MAKLSGYTVNNYPNPETDYVVIAYQGQNYKVLIGNLNFFSAWNKMKPRMGDFMGQGDIAFNTTPSPSAPPVNHPGIINSPSMPYYPSDSPVDYAFIGGEVFECIIMQSTLGAWKFGLTGFTPGTNSGIYINIDAATGVLTGKTKIQGGGASTTPTSYTTSANVWYRCKITLNVAKTIADFFLYDASGNLLWTSNIGSNIPTTMTTGFFPFSGGTATQFLDWLSITNTQEFTR